MVVKKAQKKVKMWVAHLDSLTGLLKVVMMGSIQAALKVAWLVVDWVAN